MLVKEYDAERLSELADERPAMTETFTLECPGYGKPIRAISVDTQSVGNHCSCGVTAIVDVDAQAIDDWWER